MVEISIRKQPRTEAVVTQRQFFKKTARGKVIKGSDHKLVALTVSSGSYFHLLSSQREILARRCGLRYSQLHLMPCVHGRHPSGFGFSISFVVPSRPLHSSGHKCISCSGVCGCSLAIYVITSWSATCISLLFRPSQPFFIVCQSPFSYAKHELDGPHRVSSLHAPNHPPPNSHG